MKYRWIDLNDLEDPSSPYAEYAIDAASMLLWALSGRKYSGVQTTVDHFVCPESELPIGCSWINDSTYRDDQGVINQVISALSSDMGQIKIPLRKTPVREIIEVTSEGVTIDDNLYYVESNRNLVIEDSLSSCGGVTVEYRYGVEPPSMGKLAAMSLANSIVNDLEGKECDLPSNVSSVTRQGISFEIYDPESILEKGKVGIFIVDAFITAVNPNHSKARAKIFSASVPAGRTRKTY